MGTEVFEIILTILLSSTTASLLTLFVTKRREARNIKVDLLRNIVGKMNQYTDGYTGQRDLPVYLNQVYIVFNDSAEVKKAAEELKDNLGKNNSMDYLVRLVRAMCDDTHMKYDDLTDSFICRPFV